LLEPPGIKSERAKCADTTPGATETILEEIAATTKTIVMACDKNDQRFSAFAFVDARLYPLAFTSGLYELDEVEFVRISPADAQIGLSENESHKKVAGDELAHFSAFLRREWRSNDILQGRFDGVCQIVRALLDDKALTRALSRIQDQEWLTPKNIKELFPKCPDGRLEALHESWRDLAIQYSNLPGSKELWDEKIKAAAQHFRELLILAGQEEALQEDLETIFADLHFQEVKFGRTLDPRRPTPGANDTEIETNAKKAAEDDMLRVPPEQRDKKYRDMHLGSQDITGPDGQVPNAVVGEYGTLAYLMLWGMLRRSLGVKTKAFVDKAKVRLFLRMPAQLAYHTFMLFRRERIIAVSLIMAIMGIIIGAGASTFLVGKYGLFSLAVLALMMEMTIVVNLFSDRLRKRIIAIGLIVIVLAGAAMLFHYWRPWLHGLAGFVCSLLSGCH
jgi:hypothetical protein